MSLAVEIIRTCPLDCSRNCDRVAMDTRVDVDTKHKWLAKGLVRRDGGQALNHSPRREEKKEIRDLQDP